jgi:ribosome assembly protein YihI (activator of Der GTPase)
MSGQDRNERWENLVDALLKYRDVLQQDQDDERYVSADDQEFLQSEVDRTEAFLAGLGIEDIRDAWERYAK